jgi:hypothetical protein
MEVAMHLPFIILAFAILAATPAWAADCGDTSGPGGTDVPCGCGDTVTTSTELDASDPVLSTICTGDALLVGAPFNAVDLEIGGTLRGSGQGCGIRADITSNISVTRGRITGFDRGVCLADVRGALLSHLQVQGNTSGGIQVRESGLVTVERSIVRRNGGPGMDLNGNVNAVANRIEDSAGPGLRVTIDSGEARGGVITRNVIRRNEGDGIFVDCLACSFTANQSSYNAGFGIRDVSEDSGQGENVYRNNVCTGNALGASAPPGLCR